MESRYLTFSPAIVDARRRKERELRRQFDRLIFVATIFFLAGLALGFLVR